MRAVILSGLLAFWTSIGFAQVTPDVGAEFFSKGGSFDEDRLIEYLLVRNRVPYYKLVDLDDRIDISVLKRKAVAKHLGKIEKEFGDPPYDAAAIDEFLDGLAKTESPALGIDVAGLTTPYVIEDVDAESGISKTKSYGNLKLRRSPDDLGPRTKADGALLQYSRNDQVGDGGNWISEGALIYPIATERDGYSKPFYSTNFSFGPAAYWNLIESGDKDESDIRELQFSTPIYLAGNIKGDFFDRVFVKGTPYYHTDFDFSGGTAGGTVSIEGIGNIGPVAIGKYVGVPWAKETELSKTPAYRLRVTPKLDYSNVISAGNHSTRGKGDDWFRGGVNTEFSMRFFGEDTPLEVAVGYDFLSGFSGDPEFAELFRARTTKWFSDQLGMTFEYKVGETPVSQKDLDIITVGLEFRM